MLASPGIRSLPQRGRAVRNLRAARAWARVRATCGAWPRGGLWAVAIMACTHFVLSWLVFPHTVAQERTRRKVLTLTSNATPSLVVAGDSRGCDHVVPSLLASTLRIAPEASVNLALPGCDVAGVAAWYREFSHRLAASPIMLLSVSGSMVGPRGQGGLDLNREYYAGRGIFAAVAELEPTEAVKALLAPEWTLIERVASWRHSGRAEATAGQRGFNGLPPREWSPPGDSYAEYVTFMQQFGWFKESLDREAVWQQLRGDLTFLLRCGVQLVVLDSPDHPDLLSYLAGTPAGRAHGRFRERLAQLCESLAIPLLRYDAEDLGTPNPAELFWDGVHLDRDGAAILSAKIAEDLQYLIEQRVLRLP